MASSKTGNYERIYTAVKRIPKGKVATYGHIATLAGLPGHARQVGYALFATPDDLKIPWHRVINAKGEISRRSLSDDDREQRILLEAEEIEFDERGRVSLARYEWRSSTSSKRPAHRPKSNRSEESPAIGGSRSADPIKKNPSRRKKAPMKKTDAMKQLKALGSETSSKTYARHGVTATTFGVKYGDLYKLVKRIGTDHTLAEQLWETGNHDAMVLATMIADPAQMKATTLDKWVKTVNNQPMVDAIATLATRSKHALRCMKKWTDSKQEWIAATGWHVLMGGCCGRPGEPATEIAEQPPEFFEEHLKRIESEIPHIPNRVKHSMNGALIGIGCLGGELQKKAIAAAKRIGKVEVDHGDTSCKTPDAASYILKAVAHQNKKTSSKKKKVAVRA